MIQGFPLQSSVFPGDTLTLCVSTDAPQFRVDVFRQGASLALVLSSDWFSSPAINYPDHEADQDWSQDQIEEDGLTQGWPQFPLAIPPDFTSGVYIAMLVEGDGSGNPRGNTPPLDTTTPDARFGKALFVVRSPAPGTSAKILYKLPLFTYHAYNDVGGWALYTPPTTGPEPQEGEPTFVSLRRPGGGTGGHPWDDWNFDPADRSSARQVFAHWDAPFIAWLEQNGYVIDYVTDLDLHTDPNLLAPYALVLSVGHDEYWSKEMRDQAEAFIQNGGNFAFFSGNTCWWVVEFNGDFLFQRTANWWNGPKRPENSLTGVSFRNGGEGNQDRPKVGYVVQNHDHWVFAGTELQEGDSFGVEEELVGYEADGANFDWNQGPPFVPTGDDGTPATFAILGVGDTRVFGGGNGNGAATMGVYTNTNGGTVFTGATTDWPRVVALNGESNTVQITRNVLNRVGTPPTSGLPAIAAHGNRTVAVVTTPDGGLVWTSWELGTGHGPWTSVPINGPARYTSTPPAVSFQTTEGGYSVWLAISDLEDNQIYETLQQPDGSFGPWTLIPGVVTNVSPAVSDGNLAIGVPIMVALASPPDGVSYVNVYLNDQPPNPPPPGYWNAITPSPWTVLAPALAIVGNGNYMFLAATVFSFVGPNNTLVLYQGNPYTPDQLSQNNMNFDSNVSPAMASANNRTVIVAVDPNGALFYNWWDLGGGGHGWIPLGDDVRTEVAPAVALVDNGNYMFVFARGLDAELHLYQGIVGGAQVGWGPPE